MRMTRTELKTVLESILGNNRVYFQPPSKLSYPCMLVEFDRFDVDKANNLVYNKHNKYKVTLIGKSLSQEKDRIMDDMINLEYCTFDREFINDNLYHDVFTLYC